MFSIPVHKKWKSRNSLCHVFVSEFHSFVITSSRLAQRIWKMNISLENNIKFFDLALTNSSTFQGTENIEPSPWLENFSKKNLAIFSTILAETVAGILENAFLIWVLHTRYAHFYISQTVKVVKFQQLSPNFKVSSNMLRQNIFVLLGS